MGGGDLNLKKSWHPHLMKNQERVWKQERSAIDERKRVQQLLKEQAEERQIQEMQRMGGKVDDRVEWLYNAAGSSGQQAQNEDMEAYLLGKKSVEGLFKKRDEEKMAALNNGSAANGQAPAAAASGSGFQAIGQNPNSMRDLASKVREDPLLAIKRQEQQAYEQLMKDPKRLQKLREQRQGSSKKDKKEKHREHKSEKKRHHHHHHRDRREEDEAQDGYRRRHSHRERERSRSRSRSPPPRRREYDGDYDDYDSGSRSKGKGRDSYDDRRDSRDSHRDDDRRDYSRRDDYRRSSSYHDRERQRPARRDEPPAPASTAAAPKGIPNAEERLAAMSAGASSLESSRAERLAKMKETDSAKEAEEERQRMLRKGGMDASFVKKQRDEMYEQSLKQR